MARRGSVQEIRVDFVPAISNMAAPTAAEIGAGTTLAGHMTRDGLSTPNSSSTIDVSDLADRRNKRAPGTFGGDDWTGTFFRDDVPAQDIAWDLLEQDLDGYLVIRRFGGSATPIVATNKVEVAEVSVSSRVMASPGADTPQTFMVTFAVARQNDAATIAA